MREHHDTIIGGGQAGLVMSAVLQKRGSTWCWSGGRGAAWLREVERLCPRGSLSDDRHIGPDELCALLVDRTLPPIGMTVLKVCKGGCRRDRIAFVVGVIVKRHVHERIVCKPENEIADILRSRCRQFRKHAFDPPLVFVCRLGGRHRVTGNEPLFHGTLPFVDKQATRIGGVSRSTTEKSPLTHRWLVGCR